MLLSNDFIYPYPDPMVYKEAKSMVENGYDVSVVCWSKHRMDLPASETYEGINVSRISLAKKTYYCFRWSSTLLRLHHQIIPKHNFMCIL